MIKALIFDFDGLIIDSESPELQVWQEVFAEHGRELGFDLWADLVGRPGNHFDLYSYFRQHVNPAVDIDALRIERRARVIALTEAQPVLPGVHDYLRGAAAAGLKIGLASSSSGDHVRGHEGGERLPIAAAARLLRTGVDEPREVEEQGLGEVRVP